MLCSSMLCVACVVVITGLMYTMLLDNDACTGHEQEARHRGGRDPHEHPCGRMWPSGGPLAVCAESTRIFPNSWRVCVHINSVACVKAAFTAHVAGATTPVRCAEECTHMWCQHPIKLMIHSITSLPTSKILTLNMRV